MRTLRVALLGLPALAALVLAGSNASAAASDTIRASVPNLADQGTLSTESNGQSLELAISADGRFVAFDSIGSNLVTGDTNGVGDIFVHDRQTGETTRVSLPNLADQGTLGTEANGGSGPGGGVAISADGRYVAFTSSASNLVTGDTNGVSDVFVHDRQTGETTHISVPNLADQGTLGTEADSGSWLPAMSADGRFVAFTSSSTNLVIGDTNGLQDVFVHDRQTGETTRVSVPNLADQGTLGTEGNGHVEGPMISADGRFVAFYTAQSTNLVIGDTNGQWDVFVHDRQTGETTRVSVPNLADQGTLGTEGNGQSIRAGLSSDGRYVAFSSLSTNLVIGDSNADNDVFVHDRQTGETTRVSLPNLADQGTLGTEANDWSEGYPLSANARFVAFASMASNLVLGDTNGQWDVFIHDRQTGDTTRHSVPNLADQGTLGTEANSSSGIAPIPIIVLAISADGRFPAFSSQATNLVLGDANATSDVFVHDRGPCAATPWPTPIGDGDCDGWTDADEGSIGTDPNVACDDGAGLPDWPPDFDDNKVINITDLSFVLPPFFGSTSPGPPYTTRADLVPDGVINILDVGKVLPPVFGAVCS